MASPNSSGGREQWATRIGVILAVAGSAVGLGNFLRFPGTAAQNGGGAFMLPYFISLLVLGIPLCWAEWTMGRYGGSRGFNSAPGIYGAIWRHPLAKYCGGLALLIPLIIYMYYVLIEAWCLGYAINYLTGDLVSGTGHGIDQIVATIKADAAGPISDQQARSEAFGTFLLDHIGAFENGAALDADNRGFLYTLVGVFLFNFLLIYRGVSKGIETFCKVAMPVMIVLALIVLARVLTLGTPDPAKPDQNVIGGLGYMWNPSGDALWSAKTWLAASGQIFFSLSVGFGIIVNYASYLKPKDDVALSGLTASSMNEFFEVCLGGLITIPAAFIFLGALDPGTLDSAFSLGFIALPNVFDAMWGGRVFGFLWYFMLFVAAVTSSVSMLQPVIAFFEEGLGLRRHASVTLLGLLAALGCGFVMYFSANTLALDTFDFWIGTFMIYVLAMFQVLLYGWVFGIDRGDAELHQGANIRVPRFVQYVLKFVAPVYLVTVFAVFCWQELPDKYVGKFESSTAAIDQLRQDAISESLQADFAAAGIDVSLLPPPGTKRITARGENGPWTLRDENGLPLFRITSKKGADGASVLSVAQLEMGKIAEITGDNVTLSSFCFILIIFVFLLLLIRVAGLRWRNEGRLSPAE